MFTLELVILEYVNLTEHEVMNVYFTIFVGVGDFSSHEYGKSPPVFKHDVTYISVGEEEVDNCMNGRCL